MDSKPTVFVAYDARRTPPDHPPPYSGEADWTINRRAALPRRFTRFLDECGNGD
jgi:hypothetical protein